LEKGFWSGKMEREKMGSHGKVLKMFSPLKILNSPFFKWERLLELFSLFLFFLYFFFSLFSILRLFIEVELWDFWNVWGENKKIKLSFKWDGSGYTKIHDIGGVADNASMLDAFCGMDLCTVINFFGWG
jgi:hypothetical protein